ncbi:hypothetical protein HRI_003982500 [Hibiscus trionum]|uniref:C2H2-type domain-containing protein n=1 Tax=Hibiscus trionum TaxID=183268 RepID=A0A9W7IYC2_HIBTR|nr:hypothetical protein HRI_003982500 [Hibiscus trionum]
MDQARYWVWTKRRHGLSSHHQASTKASYDDSWEEQAFAEDAAGSLGGCIWPPRSYSCSFCGREFTSAQALGGHMNVHRRDRARLKQSPSSHDEDRIHIQNSILPMEPCSFSHNPNPNSKHGTLVPPLTSEIAQDHPMKSPNASPKPCSNMIVKEEIGCKRKRTDQLQTVVVSDQLSPSSVDDIDLELRLGDRPKVR